jgi:hypothetical protein
MRFVEELCPPALLYLIFLVVQLGLDAGLGLWITFAVKLIVGLFFVYLLNTFCGIGLTPVSWFVVAAPFVITALATAMSMQMNLDQVILVQSVTKEKFTTGAGEEVSIDEPPANSSSPTLVTKTNSKWKRFGDTTR